MTACTSPPPKADVEFVRTVIVGGLATQWAAVSTFVGEITEPVQSEFVVRTAAVKPQSERLAGVPPITLALARGALAAAVPSAAGGEQPGGADQRHAGPGGASEHHDPGSATGGRPGPA